MREKPCFSRVNSIYGFQRFSIPSKYFVGNSWKRMDQHFILFLVGLLWVLITTTIVPVNSEEWTMDIEYFNDTISNTTTEPTPTTFTTETPFSPIPGFNIDFENGTIAPWVEASRRSVKWKIENTNSPWESDNAAPTPLNGSSYLRVDRGASLSFGVAILRSPVIIATAGVSSAILSFSFWIRSKWSQYTNLEVINVEDTYYFAIQLFLSTC